MGKQLEQTITVDDSALPSPQELEAYKRIDPRIVDLLIENTRKEQQHRHETDRMKLKILRRSESRIERINFWGMTFAYLFATSAPLRDAKLALVLILTQRRRGRRVVRRVEVIIDTCKLL